MKRRKEPEQQMRGSLYNVEYRDARRQLAVAQCERMNQIVQMAAADLVETAAARRLLLGCRARFAARQQIVEKRFAAKFPNLPPDVLAWLQKANETALQPIDDALASMKLPDELQA